MKQSQRSSIGRILVPIDFSPASLRALDYAVERARESGSTIILLHVIEPILAETRFVSRQLRALKADARLANKRLLSLAKKRVKVEVPVDAWILNGDPGAMIITGAADTKADLIIMGSVGRKGLRRLFLGSVAERVIRDAHCPVTIVRAPRLRKQKPTRSELRRGSAERSAVVLIGPPGSGKTTLARALAEWTSLSVIEVGNLLKQEVKRGTKLGRRIRPYTSAGTLVPLELVMDLVSNALKDAKEDILLFDGIPRSAAQILPFLELLAGHNLDLRAVIFLTLDLQTALARLNGRRVCKRCGALYNIAAGSPSVANCERCGGELIQRRDDSENIVRERFKRFERETMPVVKFFQKEFHEVTWEQSATAPAKQRTDRIWRKLEKALSTPAPNTTIPTRP